MHATNTTVAPCASLPRPQAGRGGIRARVWVEARHFFLRAEAQGHAWLWLLCDDGRVLALRLDARLAGQDHLLPRLLDATQAGRARNGHGDASLGMVRMLPGAPVVPVPRWAVSWGHPLQRAVRAFAERLDAKVLEVLGDLELPGPFFGSVENYNRLALLPQPQRRHRLQALAGFPALVAPQLLVRHDRPDLTGDDSDGIAGVAAPEASLALLDAIDHGRDLSGALASEYRIDRALVRSPLCREAWAGGYLPRDGLRLLQALPAHARPRAREDVEPRLPLLAELPVRADTQRDVARVARPFARGWTETWEALDAEFQPLPSRLRDSRDFLRSALEQADLPGEPARIDVEMLATAWIARRGIASLLHASRRWHAQPLRELPQEDDLPDEVRPLFGVLEFEDGRALDLNTRRMLRDEGDAMGHCVGDYWADCVFGPTRIVHLERDGCRTATAQYDCVGSDSDPRFELRQLRGPFNSDCDDGMLRLARRVGIAIQSDELRERRAELVRDARRARAMHRTGVRTTMRPLDRRSRGELRTVLDYCAKQDDWCTRPAPLLRAPVAGFRYAHGPRLLARLAAGDALELVREPDNPHDARAVRIDWNGFRLGYVPRAENPPVAHLLDAGARLAATIAAVRPGDSWAPVDCVVSQLEGGPVPPG